MRLKYFDYFRGIAILLIVTGHSYSPWEINAFHEKVIANLIKGGTALFVFISGFFFHYIFYPKFVFSHFLLKKSKQVLLPYLILSNIGFLIVVVLFKHRHPGIVSDVNTTMDGFLLYAKYIWTGRMFLAYWYISFIMIMFTLSPIFIKYIEIPRRYQISIFAICLTVSMVVHRPIYNLSPLHSVIYFTPIYMLGILFSINVNAISKFIKNKTLLLGIATIVTSVVQVYLTNDYGNYHKEKIFSISTIDIIIVQKILMTFFMLSVLQRFDDKHISFLSFFASTSFAIFFLHPWVLSFLRYISFDDYIKSVPGAVIVPLKTLLVVALCQTIAIAFKKVLGRKSAYIIGW